MSKPARFIVLRKFDGKWERSLNKDIKVGICFDTREAAQEAINTYGSNGIQYRVRQK